MKKCAMVVAILLATSSLALAEWLVDFKDTYRQKGIDEAVERAMEEGIAPDSIVENGLMFEGLNPTNLVKALYCAGAQGQDVRAAAEQYGISELMVAAGYKKSIAECGDKVADAQAFTPVATARSFPQNRNRNRRGNASPATP